MKLEAQFGAENKEVGLISRGEHLTDSKAESEKNITDSPRSVRSSSSLGNLGSGNLVTLPVYENLVIVGAGVSGIFAAIALSKKYRKIFLLEQKDEEIYEKQILARDKHGHICVSAALTSINNLIPNFSEELKRNGVSIGDPGTEISWTTGSVTLQKAETGSSCGFGSYRGFIKALQCAAKLTSNIETVFSVKSISVNPGQKTIGFMKGNQTQSISYNSLLVATGSKGRELNFLDDWGVEYKTTTFGGRGAYHSFDVRLKFPLALSRGFISEADPKKKLLSFLYVPRNPTEGILTIGNFGSALKIRNETELKEVLKPWKEQLPLDFLSKVDSISNQSDFGFSEVCWHQLKYENQNIYLIGDALLKVPPYLGLGLNIAVQSVLSVMEHQESQMTTEAESFKSIFQGKANEVFVRVFRYERLWGDKNSKAVRMKIRIFLRKLFLQQLSRLIFSSAGESKVVARYLVRRFHLVEQSRSSGFIKLIFTIITENFSKKTSMAYEKVFKAH